MYVYELAIYVVHRKKQERQKLLQLLKYRLERQVGDDS